MSAGAVLERTAPVARKAYDTAGACAALSIGKTELFELIGSGRLRSFKCGRRRYVSAAAIDEYIADQEAAEGAALEAVRAPARAPARGRR